MALSAGTRLGPYELVAPVGAGGMGEVYRAKDTRLDRTVAVKVLPPHLSTSPESRQRFEREAKTISQLSHPHICALYDVGHQDGIEFLVMEYLEGETLAERLAKGPLSLDLVLRYGAEIADALDKAHRQGIVHRDLKPGNVMITKAGVKLLDFGLAKAFERSLDATGREQMAAAQDPMAGRNLTTLSTELGALTQQGTLLGTLQYMAPEQLEGKEADARTDVFAFGAVLYEMATGKKTFSGATQASLIGSILRDEPRPISEAVPLTPRALDRIVRICLAKDPEERWQTAHDVGLQLREIDRDRDHPDIVVARPARSKFSRALPWGVALVALGIGALLGRAAPPKNAAAKIVRSTILAPPNTEFHFLDANAGPPAVSPDGTRIAFVARNLDDQFLLWVRRLDSLDAFPIPGSSGAAFPFWSPDGKSIGFFAQARLKVVEASGSAPPVSLADVEEARGGSWAANGTILFSPGYRDPIRSVPASGGSTTPLTEVRPREVHRWPVFLPDGRHFLFNVRVQGEQNAVIYAGSLDSRDRREVLRGEHTDVAFVAPDHLLFRRGGRLVAARFDPDRLAVVGDPVELVDNIDYFPPTGRTTFGVSQNVLAYTRSSDARLSRLAWFDRAGRELGGIAAPGMYASPCFSPDGRQLAVSVMEQLVIPPDIWLFDTRLGTGTRTSTLYPDLSAVFSADGKRIFFGNTSEGKWNIHVRDAASGSDLTTLLPPTRPRWPRDVSPEGSVLLYHEVSPANQGDLKVLPLTGERRPRDFVASPYDEDEGTFSPDGRWVAYVSDESGRKEVFVASFPDPSRRIRVSSDGGNQPRWSRDGRELFYIAKSYTMMAAPFDSSGAGPTAPPSRLFDVPISYTFGSHAPLRYDVSPDGRFLVAVRASNDPPPSIVFVLNWQSALTK
ncbi:MAG TPA: protein kinase [Thermoanaerobaculia bacterium]|nr:protein kinase [Thermoanaerobaculia bacterium]